MRAMYGFALTAARAKKFSKALLAHLRGVVTADATGRPLRTSPKCWKFEHVVACGQAGSLVLAPVGRRGAEIRQGRGDSTQGDDYFPLRTSRRRQPLRCHLLRAVRQPAVRCCGGCAWLEEQRKCQDSPLPSEPPARDEPEQGLIKVRLIPQDGGEDSRSQKLLFCCP